MLPSDPENYYSTRNLVPRDMLADTQKAKIVITNYHSFMLREKLEASKLGKEILGGRKGAKSFIETEGEMIARVCSSLMGRKDIIVINDEAHHCYRHKVESEEERLTGEDKEEAKKNNEAARVWISGLEAINRKLGVKAVYDLSATPFFLKGSGYTEGALFPWVVSDFSLMDGIESGIVKVPRVPVADDQVQGDLPLYRNVYKHVKDRLPKKGRRNQGENLDPEKLPVELVGALEALYGHYDKTSTLWTNAGFNTPPVFIVVCNNTSTSKLVYDYIACWFIDTDYDEVSFFVRHAYFLGGKDPYNKLKRAMNAEIDEEAWATLYSTESHPFPKPSTGKIAVKVINHYGDEVMKVFNV